MHFLCLQQVKQTRDKIKQYQRKIEQSLEKERLLAKELLKNGKKEYVAYFCHMCVCVYLQRVSKRSGLLNISENISFTEKYLVKSCKV